MNSLSSLIRRSGAIALLLTATQPAVAATLNTAQIIASAVSPSCISWRISGICYWLQCTPWGCKVRTSVKVTHFIPQAIVSTYGSPGENPWREMSQVSGSAGGVENALTGSLSGITAGWGNHQQKAPGQRKSNIYFYYADAIGHPATAIIGSSVPGYACKSAATPFLPYFLSTLDSLVWRTGVPEALYPESLIPGRRELGSQAAGNMWGNLYPRSGFVNQTDGNKASAVVAQRVADIITRTGQPHVYSPLKGKRADGYWPPGEVVENSGTKNHKWQRLSPTLSPTCAVFPDGEHTADVSGQAAYALWQPYSCCQKRGQRFLSSTNF